MAKLNTSTPSNNNNKMSPKSAATVKGGNILAKKSSLTRAAVDNLAVMSPESGTTMMRPATARTPLTALLNRNHFKVDNNLMLISVTVLGSPGPLRFLVDKNDKVARVVEVALRVYSREGRLPALNTKCVELYCNNGDYNALELSQSVGDLGTRQFLLYRKEDRNREEQRQQHQQQVFAPSGGSGPLKHWWNLVSSIVCSH